MARDENLQIHIIRRCVMGKQATDETQGKKFRGSPKGRLLLVDEDLNDLLLYSITLRNHGYQVRMATSYSEAAVYLGREDFDLVIVNQGNGAFELRPVMERAADGSCQTPVLVLTGSSDIECFLEAMELGAVAYLEKPQDPSEVAKLAEQYLQFASEQLKRRG
jgi:DNA-binding NtrC family response regulator